MTELLAKIYSQIFCGVKKNFFEKSNNKLKKKSKTNFFSKFKKS